MNHLWIMGCGDIGRRVASLYQKQQRRVIGWVKSAESLRLGEAQGISMRRGDLDADDLFADEAAVAQFMQQFEGVDVFWFMPPGSGGKPKSKIHPSPPRHRFNKRSMQKEGDSQQKQVAAGGPPTLKKGERGGFKVSAESPKLTTDTRLHNFLSTVKNAPRRITLISTTGVYGDCQGRWIDESEPLKPKAERAIRRVDAETALQQWSAEHDRESVILRVPGIYAQDRLPLARLKRGEPVLAADEAPWTNRIHADDLALVCQTVMERAPSNTIYNATDGQPSTMTEYFHQVADFAGLPRAPEVSLAQAKTSMSAGMLSYLAESRRIGNDKLLAELGVTLRYPSLKDGLYKD